MKFKKWKSNKKKHFSLSEATENRTKKTGYKLKDDLLIIISIIQSESLQLKKKKSYNPVENG